MELDFNPENILTAIEYQILIELAENGDEQAISALSHRAT